MNEHNLQGKHFKLLFLCSFSQEALKMLSDYYYYYEQINTVYCIVRTHAHTQIHSPRLGR